MAGTKTAIDALHDVYLVHKYDEAKLKKLMKRRMAIKSEVKLKGVVRKQGEESTGSLDSSIRKSMEYRSSKRDSSQSQMERFSTKFVNDPDKSRNVSLVQGSSKPHLTNSIIAPRNVSLFERQPPQ